MAKDSKKGKDINLTSEVANFYQDKIEELEKRKDNIDITQKLINDKKGELEKIIKKVQVDIVKTGTVKEDLTDLIDSKDVKRLKRVVVKALRKVKLGGVAQKINFLSPSTALTAAYRHLKSMDEKLGEDSNDYEDAEEKIDLDMQKDCKDRDELLSRKYADVEALKGLIQKKNAIASELNNTDKLNQEVRYFELDKQLIDTEKDIRDTEKRINDASKVIRIVNNKLDGSKAYLRELEVMKTSLSAVQEPVKMLMGHYDSQIKNQTRMLKMSEDIQDQRERLLTMKALFNNAVGYTMLKMGEITRTYKALQEPLFTRETLKLTEGVAEDVRKRVELGRIKDAYDNIMEVENSYNRLGLRLGDDETAIKAAFVTMVRRVHPDANPDGPADGKEFSNIGDLVKAKDLCMSYAKSIKASQAQDELKSERGAAEEANATDYARTGAQEGV